MQDQAAETLLDVVTPNFVQYKDAPAVRFDDGEAILVSTYSQLQKSTEKITAALERFHVKDEIVGVCISPSHNLPSVLLGVLGSGGAFYNFEPNCVNFVRHVIREMGIRVVLVDPENLQKWEPMLLGFDAVTVSDAGIQDIGVMLVQLQGTHCKHTGSLAYCITTSGTTGTPKIVRVPHQCILPNIMHLRNIFKIKDNDLIFLSSPLTFDPSIVDVFLALGSGACLLIVPHTVKMMPRSLLSMLYYRHKVTYLQATPSLVSRIGSEVLKKTLLGSSSQLRTLAFGGEKFPSISLIQKWRAPDNSTKFFNLYGTTEVSCWSTCYEVTDRDFSNLTDDIPLGQPLKDTIVTVLENCGREVLNGRGQLHLGGIKRRQCYLVGEEADSGQPILRATGDTVAINSKREIIFLSREDDQVKRNGQRINLCEVEKTVLKLENVADCRVVFDQKKLLIFVISQGTNKIVPLEIHHWIQKCLPSQYWPDSVVIVPKFPVTNHGKLDKTKLLQTCYEPGTVMNVDTARRIPVIVEKIWMDILLRDERPTTNTRFITSGGDSLMAVQFSDKIESTFNIRLPKLLDVVLHDVYTDILGYIEGCLCDQIPLQQNSRKEKACSLNHLKVTNNTEPVLKKLRTGSLNVNYVDDLIEKKKLDLSISLKNNELIKKRKCADKDNLEIYKDENQGKKIICDESLIRSKDNHYKSFGDQIIWSVGRGNSGMNRGTDMKADLRRKYRSFYHSSTSDLQTPDSNLEGQQAENLCGYTPHQRDITLSVCWKVNTGKCVDASPVIARDRIGRHTVYIGSHSHEFTAITMETGEVKWKTTLGDRIESSACVSACGHYVIVGCYDGTVYVMEHLTGEIWWKYKTGAEVKSSPAVDPQTAVIYVGSHDQHLHALDLKMRMCLFKTYLGGGSVFSSPSVNSLLHTVYVGTLSGAVSAVDSRNGDILWTYNCKKPVFSSPFVSSEGIYIGCVDGCLYHLSTDGVLIWFFHTLGPVFSSPATYLQLRQQDLKSYKNKSSNQMIVFGSHDHCVYFLSYDGKLLWKKKLDSPVYSTPFCFDLVFDEQWKQSQIRFEYESVNSSKEDSVPVEGDVNVINGSKSHQQENMTNSNINFSLNQRHVQENCCTKFGISGEKDFNFESMESDELSGGKNKTKCGPTDVECCNDLTQCNITGTLVHQQSDKVNSNVEELSKDLTVPENQESKLLVPERFTSQVGHKDMLDCQQYTENPMSRSPHHIMPLCVVATTTGSIHVIDRRVGQEVGMVRLPGEVFSSPVVCGNNIIVGCRDNYVYCLKVTPGTTSTDANNT